MAPSAKVALGTQRQVVGREGLMSLIRAVIASPMASRPHVAQEANSQI
jgi:hypothetical protein